MKPNLYLIQTHRINLTNLFMGMLILNEGPLVYETCKYSLTANNKFFQFEPGNMVKHFVSNPAVEFRKISWSQSIDKLKTIVDLAKSKNQILIFGNHNVDELRFLKDYFKSDALTISLNYNEDLYSRLLDNAVAYHIWMLSNGMVEKNSQDQTNLDNLSYNEQMSYYKQVFTQLNLFPQSSSANLDYNIDINDFFDESTMFDHFNSIDINLTDKAKQYYRTWRLSSV